MITIHIHPKKIALDEGHSCGLQYTKLIIVTKGDEAVVLYIYKSREEILEMIGGDEDD